MIFMLLFLRLQEIYKKNVNVYMTFHLTKIQTIMKSVWKIVGIIALVLLSVHQVSPNTLQH